MDRKPKPAKNQVQSFPAPIGGLNLRDSLAAMPPTDSPAMTNWIPDIGGLRSRKGTLKWSSPSPGIPIKTVLGYFGVGTQFVAASDTTPPSVVGNYNWAANDNGLYAVIVRAGPPNLSKSLSGTANAGIISSVAFANASDTYLLMCSETDGYFYHASTSGLFTAAPAVTGVSISSLCFVTSWKRRVWFVERNTTKAWYLPADAIVGAATSFNFGPLFKHGGYLSYLANWTIDAGEGIDDFLVVVSTMGDVLVYKGTDPASASTFELVGSWYVGPVPAGRKGFCQYGGDLIILSVNGLFPISYVTRGGTDMLLASGKEYSSKISPALSTDIRQTFTDYGWEMVLHPQERLLIITVPDYGTSSNKQYVLDTALNAWTVFNDIPIRCMSYAGQFLFGGTTDGRVLLLNFGFTDEMEVGVSLGNVITGQVAFPFSYLGSPAVEKHFLMGRPVFLSALEPAVEFDVSVNFVYEDQPPTISGSTDAPIALFDLGEFDFAIWDSVSTTYSAWHDWGSVDGVGFSGAITLRTSVSAYTTLVSADILYETGGVL